MNIHTKLTSISQKSYRATAEIDCSNRANNDSVNSQKLVQKSENFCCCVCSSVYVCNSGIRDGFIFCNIITFTVKSNENSKKLKSTQDEWSHHLCSREIDKEPLVIFFCVTFNTPSRLFQCFCDSCTTESRRLRNSELFSSECKCKWGCTEWGEKSKLQGFNLLKMNAFLMAPSFLPLKWYWLDLLFIYEVQSCSELYVICSKLINVL